MSIKSTNELRSDIVTTIYEAYELGFDLNNSYLQDLIFLFMKNLIGENVELKVTIENIFESINHRDVLIQLISDIDLNNVDFLRKVEAKKSKCSDNNFLNKNANFSFEEKLQIERYVSCLLEYYHIIKEIDPDFFVEESFSKNLLKKLYELIYILGESKQNITKLLVKNIHIKIDYFGKELFLFQVLQIYSSTTFRIKTSI
jgi:hypothetical protein